MEPLGFFHFGLIPEEKMFGVLRGGKAAAYIHYLSDPYKGEDGLGGLDAVLYQRD